MFFGYGYLEMVLLRNRVKGDTRCMRLIVQVDPGVVRKLHRGKPLKSALPDVGAVVDSLSLPIHPLHPNVDDEALESYFVIDVPNKQVGEEAAKRFRRCQGIRAAYVKPPVSLP